MVTRTAQLGLRSLTRRICPAAAPVHTHSSLADSETSILVNWTDNALIFHSPTSWPIGT